VGTDEAAMANNERPFTTIESAHEYLSLLSDQIAEVMHDVMREIATSTDRKQERRAEAWQTVLYTLTKLQFNTASSRRLVNDLRMLRNLLFRTSDRESEPVTEAPVPQQSADEGRPS
jgi:hypothetical protein